MNVTASMRWLSLIAASIVWLTWLLTLPPRPDNWLVFISGLPLILLGSRAAASSRGESWRAFAARTFDHHVVWLVLLFALGVQFEDAHGVTTDGVIYFTQLRSVVFDFDLDVAREFAYLQQPARPGHIVPIGTIPVWLPLYLAVAAVDAAGRAMGTWPAPDDAVAIGLTLPYVRAVLISSFVVGGAGLLVVHRMLRREFDAAPALAATLLLIGATSLFWYLVYEPSMTHAASFGFVAFFVAAAAGSDPATSSPKRLMAIGFLLGLAFITRPQEAVFALLPAMLVATRREPIRRRLAIARRYALWAFAGFAPLLALQLAQSALLFSRERLVIVGGDEGFLNLMDSRWSETLWSSWHGFFSWTPVAYIALLGTLAYARRQVAWAIATVLIVFVMAWINGATPDLGAGWSFGGRRFISCLVLVAPGLALILQALQARPIVSIALIASALLSWNVLLMAQYRGGLLSSGRPIAFSEITRRQAELYTRPPYLYPFAFPANVLFAWRTGLPVDRYDLLGTEPMHPALDLELGAAAGKFLLEGWGAPTGDETGDAWWIAATPATLALPLALPDGRQVRVEVKARTRLAEPLVQPTLAVVVNGREIGTFVPQAHQPSDHVFETAKGGLWRDGFNRVSLVSRDSVWPVAIYRVRITPF